MLAFLSKNRDARPLDRTQGDETRLDTLLHGMYCTPDHLLSREWPNESKSRTEANKQTAKEKRDYYFANVHFSQEQTVWAHVNVSEETVAEYEEAIKERKAEVEK